MFRKDGIFFQDKVILVKVLREMEPTDSWRVRERKKWGLGETEYI